jgi:penicillin amidase
MDALEASMAMEMRGAPAEEALMPRREQGSNAWAVTPARSASGHALLFINPHLPFFGPSQVYEGHVMSDEGWNFTGYTRFGFPMPYVGFNEDLGWASTDNAADLSDLYVETFDHPDDTLAYRYGDGYRTAVAWVDTIRVASGDGVEARVARFRKTHHGPIVAERDGRPRALRMARYEEPGWLDQWYAMTRARSYEAFLEAAGRLDMLFGNYLYADRAGNIFYAYNAAVPRRDERFDWSETVEGRDPATEWQGYHPLAEIPQVLNPPSGFLQNCNGTPFLATAEANPDPAAFPSYMVREGDNARSRAARRILTGRDTFTFDAWARLSYDTYVVSADENVPALVRAWEQAGTDQPERARRLADAVDLLRAWDRISTVGSEAMTLYVYYGEALFGGGGPLEALEQAVEGLERDWGTLRVPWGEVNRLQRVHSSGTGFDDDAPSLPVAGVPSWAGSMFTFWAQQREGTQRRYGAGGNTYVAVVEFGPQVRGRSLHPFGYQVDQSPRYAAGDYKPAWLTLEDVRANAVNQQSVVYSH